MSNSKNAKVQKKMDTPATPNRVQEEVVQKSILENLIDAEFTLARVGFFMNELYKAVGLPVTRELNEAANNEAERLITAKYPNYTKREVPAPVEAPEAVAGPAELVPGSECDAVVETKEI